MYYRHEHALGALFDSVGGQKRLPLIQQFFFHAQLVEGAEAQ